VYFFVPGLLKVRTGAHEFITPLMLNTIGGTDVIYVTRSGDFSRRPATIASVPLLYRTCRPSLLAGASVAALATAVVISFLVFRTTFWLPSSAQRVTPHRARTAGMRPAWPAPCLSPCPRWPSPASAARSAGSRPSF